jgi:hypothetical protein
VATEARSDFRKVLLRMRDRGVRGNHAFLALHFPATPIPGIGEEELCFEHHSFDHLSEPSRSCFIREAVLEVHDPGRPQVDPSGRHGPKNLAIFVV